MQYVLGLKIPHITASLLRQLEGSYGSLSVQKFSSNVVEKCLKESHKVQRTRIIKELLDSPHAVMIMQNAYGNYVMQSALVVSKVRLSDKFFLIYVTQLSLMACLLGFIVISCLTFRLEGWI